MKVIPVSAPPRVRALLRSAPDGAVPLVHRGRDAVYVEIGGRCVGVVSIGDLVKHRIAEIEREAEEMRTYIATA